MYGDEDNPRSISAFSLHRFCSRQDSILLHVPRHELLFPAGDRSCDNSNDSENHLPESSSSYLSDMKDDGAWSNFIRKYMYRRFNYRRFDLTWFGKLSVNPS